MSLTKRLLILLSLVLLSISSARADYLSDLCDDLYSKINDPSVGSSITRQLYQEKIVPEVKRVVEQEIADEMYQFYNDPNFAGYKMKPHRMNEYERRNIYLAHKQALKIAGQKATNLIKEWHKDESGLELMKSKLHKLSGGEKLKRFTLILNRAKRHNAAFGINPGAQKKYVDEIRSYEDQVYCMAGTSRDSLNPRPCLRDGLIFKILKSFNKSAKEMWNYLNGPY